ncbi:MAG: bifunctional phosphopantothenoylcysteine decarboxylase/phosphopantothenate--cysteine ligase CoaBC, partial [Armatimonadetes bacterium]|nr:bifunctional phosphopantothenoylcysteine decarboxylase/phosphopantothenate--cysteine ligase CoaBC [Armatimonadota bacterium]
MPTFKGRRVVVGVTGSIAAYKAAELVSALRQRQADVRVIMTANACALVGPPTFRALSGHEVATELFGGAEYQIEHVSLARFAEAIIIAPATANVIGKIAAGIADDLLTTQILAAQCPIVVAPAMNWRMWDNPVVQKNVSALRERGVVVVDPEPGFLACGEEGGGRLASLPRLLAAVRYALRLADLAGEPSPLAGRKVVVTAGPTREHIDPIRFISNPSSGAMGFELARELRARGAEVIVVHGPTHLDPPAD